jgi:hypothetical protein
MVNLEVLAHLPVKEVSAGDRAWTELMPNYAETAKITLSHELTEDYAELGWLRKMYYVLGVGYLKHTNAHTLAFGLNYVPGQGVTKVSELPIDQIPEYKTLEQAL